MGPDRHPDPLADFHPVVAGWFRQRFKDPTPPQAIGWPAIRERRDTLIAAPTGAGKTLAAFLVCIDDLFRRGLGAPSSPASSTGEGGIDVLYLSPLKALSNDVGRNLEMPLAEISAAALREGIPVPEVRVAVRTGDTPASERARMRKTPPNILVTTPESLFILLTAGASRDALASVRTVIVDEIHAIADDKRGAHLAVSLERLDRLVEQRDGRKPVRIGLSATQSPIERIAHFLVGNKRPPPTVIDTGLSREIDIAIELTDDELGAVASNEQCDRAYDRIAEMVRDHDTTLVFANTRRLVERVAHALEERLGEGQVVAHHGSLSRRIRFAAEQKLKTGEVRCAVATASLELGIDVGSVDLVVQLGSPRSISTLVQRIGRSGHSLGKTPRGRLLALTRDQLVECAALVRAVKKRRLDAIDLRRCPRDILAQHLVAMAACEPLGEDEAYELIKGSASYGELPRREYDAVIEMLSDGISTIRGRRGAHLHRDRVNRTIVARRGARLAALTCSGAIPDNANYPVITYPEETPVGSLDEDFAIESHPGDIFLLGNTSWRIRRVEAGRVLVEDAGGAPPTIPFWFGEAPARTAELSEEVSDLRCEIEERIDAGASRAEIAEWASAACNLSIEGADQMVAYLWASRLALGALPTRDRLIVERFFDDGGGMQLVIHSPLGGRINKAWGLALRKRFCRSFNFELQAAATDDGLLISLGPPHSFPLHTVFEFLTSKTALKVLEQAVIDAPVFGVRWRWNATRALAVLRRFGGKKVPPHLLRMRTDDLMTVVFPMAQACLENVVGDIELPDHPLVNETMDDCLGEFMDAAGFLELIGRIERGDIELHTCESTEPSPLSHELISANPYAFLDDVPLEERRTRAVSVPRGIRLGDGDDGTRRVIDDDAIGRAESEAEPAVRDPDELHDLLLSTVLLPPRPEWGRHFADLVAARRAAELRVVTPDGDVTLWVASERLSVARALHPDAALDPDLPPEIAALGGEVPALEVAVKTILRGTLELCGPRSAAELAARMGAAEEVIDAGLCALEGEGGILRGSFSRRAVEGGVIEWVDRRVLARIHRIAVGRLRRSVEPVDAAALMRFLFRWQRLSPGAQAIGEDGLRAVVDQLQGFECAAGSWESEILPARVSGYQPGWLDSLCLSGEVAWARLSPRVRGGDGSGGGGGGSGGEGVGGGGGGGGSVGGGGGVGVGVAPKGGGKHHQGASPEAGTEVGDPVKGASSRGEGAPTNAREKRSAAPTRAAPLTLCLRPDLQWLRGPCAALEGDSNLDGDAARVLELLRERGALFLPELVSASGLDALQVEEALWQLVCAGAVHADGFASLRLLIRGRRRGRASRFDRADSTSAGSPSRSSKWQRVVDKARRRDARRPAHADKSVPTASGRWSRLPEGDGDGDPERFARQLLHRYGVVFRELLGRETNLPSWRDILGSLRRLEARGEIRGGRFVSGFVGEQFALPEAVEGLRAVRRADPRCPQLVRVSATDPLNLVGITSPGPRVPAVMGNAVLYRDGVAIATVIAGELSVIGPLREGEAITPDLGYQAPPRERHEQVALPL